MGSELDSAVEFERRAKALGVDDIVIQTLKAENVDTYGKFAFSVAYAPGAADETPLLQMITRVAGDPPPPAQAAAMRRLFWESHTLALADLKQRSEHGSDSVSKKLPASERKARSDAQRGRLTGLTWGPDAEPSHQLVDRFVAMYEENIISYVKPEFCTSRSYEVLNAKQTPSFSLGSDGNLKLKEASHDQECAVNGEMRLREAFRRKALAMDLAQLVSYNVAEEWHAYLFMSLQRETPKGFRGITVAQLIAADKRLWVLVSEATRGNTASPPGRPKPCDQALKDASSTQDVLSFLLPVPDVHHPVPTYRAEPYPTPPPKGAGKGAKGHKGKSAPEPLPEGCSLKKPDGKPICGLYNRGRCWTKCKPGKRCSRGFHVCFKCFRDKHHFTNARIQTDKCLIQFHFKLLKKQRIQRMWEPTSQLHHPNDKGSLNNSFILINPP